MSKPAIALYLGESYATIGLFDTSQKNQPAPLFEKSIFLPQVSLKNLLIQTKVKVQEFFTDSEAPIPVYIVTKYLDRLKQFRLGGSISQVILKGFENSYTLSDSKCLSLAAAQLIISLEPENCNEEFFTQELDRIKKINPDLNKVVISVPEESITSTQLELIHNFFSTAGLKIFSCTSPHNQNNLRKTLLNAGSEGTKEEIINDLKEILGENTLPSFFCKDRFEAQFENCELFTSANNFLAQYIKSNNCEHGAFFDIESLKFISLQKLNVWQSPWGAIPIDHFRYSELSIHPFSEVKLDHLSLLQIDSSLHQLEPGPVVAGRAIKPLVIDMFYDELLQNELAKSLFSQLAQENLKQKVQNLFSVLQKGQKNPSLATQISEVKKNILETLYSELQFHSHTEKTLVFGPLTDVFMPLKEKNKMNILAKPFSWTEEIMRAASTKASL